MRNSQPMYPHAPLVPGFMVIHGNHPESLRDLLVTWMGRYPLAPLEDELVLVQSNGVAQWLKLSLASGPAQGGIGIAAAMRTELPARALWDIYRAVLGDAIPPSSVFEKSRLAWRLMRGEGVEKDPEQAVHWMGRAAAHGIVDAQYQAGIWLELLGRAEEGQAWLARAAEQGDARARACLPPGP